MGRPRLPSGLYQRIDSQGRIRYKSDFQCRGRRFVLGHGAIGRAEAEQRHQAFWDYVHYQAVGLPAPDPEPASYTFAEVVAQYIADLRALKRRERAIETAEAHAKVLSKYFGRRPMASITAADVKELRDSLLRPSVPGAKPRSSRTVKNYLDTAHTVFEYGIRQGYIRSNPVKAVAKPTVNPIEYKDFWDLHPREDARLLEAFVEPWGRCAAAIALYLGLRITPTISLRLEDIDLLNEAEGRPNPALRILGSTNKGRRGKGRKTEWEPIPFRILPLIADQVRAARSAGSPWLFPSPKDPRVHVGRHAVLHSFQRAAARIGIEGVGFHDLRHIADRRLKAAGLAELRERAEAGARAILGHDSRAASSMYSRHDADALRPVTDRLEAWLDSKANQPKESTAAH